MLTLDCLSLKDSGHHSKPQTRQLHRPPGRFHQYRFTARTNGSIPGRFLLGRTATVNDQRGIAMEDSIQIHATPKPFRAPLTRFTRRQTLAGVTVPYRVDFPGCLLALGPPDGFLPFSSGGPFSPPASAAPPRSLPEPGMARPGSLFPEAPVAARRLVSRPTGRFMLVLPGLRPAVLRVGRGRLFPQASSARAARRTSTPRRPLLRSGGPPTSGAPRSAFFYPSRPPLDVIPILEAPRSFGR